MIRVSIPTAFLAALALLPLQAAAADSYKVSARIAHNGAPIGSPTLTVKQGEPASMSTTGANGYALQVKITPGEEDAIELEARLETRRGSVSTVVTTKPGKPVKLSTGDIDFGVTAERIDDDASGAP